MEHNEPWQLFSQNGLPLAGESATRDEVAKSSSYIIGAAHVWIWRQSNNGVEVLLQKRSTTKKTWPGYLDISAAGHIDAGETSVESAVREAEEEIGLALLSEKLYYIFSLRTPLDSREFDTVFLYKLENESTFTFNDGEVEELLWKNLEEFEEMTKNPDEHMLVPQGDEYFSLVFSALRRLQT